MAADTEARGTSSALAALMKLPMSATRANTRYWSNRSMRLASPAFHGRIALWITAGDRLLRRIAAVDQDRLARDPPAVANQGDSAAAVLWYATASAPSAG
ncbi:hypothetical protein G6F23_015256 [Rhizopus arrhizus]|nr:hypothetical protein G6F23_015256 [Rhizopus arrhizus]